MIIAKDENGHDDGQMKMTKMLIRMRRLEVGLSLASAVILLLTMSQIVNSWFTVTSISARVQDIEDKNLVYTSKLDVMDERVSLLSQEQKSFIKQMIDEQRVVSEKFVQFENERKIIFKQMEQKKKQKSNQVPYRNVRNERVYGGEIAKESSYFSTEKNKEPMISMGEIQMIPITETRTNDYDKFIEKNDFEIKKEEKQTISVRRKLEEIDENSTYCDTNIFELILELDEYPDETSWELVDIQNQNIVANGTNYWEEAFSRPKTTICLEDGFYVFTIFDSFSDGMCFGFDPDHQCSPYMISINNEVVIDGVDFLDKATHRLSIKNGIPCLGNVIEIESELFVEGGSWELKNTKKTEVVAKSSSIQNDWICGDDGIFLFTSSNRKNEEEYGFMKISVNGDILIEGPLLSIYRFYISDVDVGRYDCTKKPTLGAFNDYSARGYDQRTVDILNVFREISSFDDINNKNSPQYKAACQIIVDDEIELLIQDDTVVERYILILFSFSTGMVTNGDEIPMNSCDYQGVICDIDGFIIEIDFYEKGLKGTILNELGYLRHIKYIDFSSNSLTGTIPIQLSFLSNLELLYLDSNYISGTIPSELGKLENLKFLSFENNDISGTIPPQLFDATELKSFVATLNYLTGTIPNTISQLHQMDHFWLPDNQLTGTIPTEVGLMKNLRNLFLNNNQLEGELPREIMNCPLLERFFIFNNHLTGSLPDIFDSLYNLVWFSAYNNAFSGQIPDSIWNMSSLQDLQLHSNDLTGSVPDTYCLDFNISTDLLQVDDLSWFSESPEVECSCCQKACHLWDPVLNLENGPVDCPEENIMDLFGGYDINPSQITDIHTKETLSPSEGFCASPTGCYSVYGFNITDGINLTDAEAEADTWYFGYSNSSRSLKESDSSNPVCDTIDICGKSIGSKHPVRNIINYVTQVGLFNLDLIYDPTSYQQKALCSILDNNYDFIFFDDLSDCDGTMLQFFALHVFLNSLKYFDEDNFILTTNEMCEITGAYCDDTTKFIEKIDLQDKNLMGSISSEIGFLERLKEINLSENKIKGTIDKSGFSDKLQYLEIINLGNNSLQGEGDLIKVMLERPFLREFNISNNIFIGDLPQLTSYPATLELFDVSNNLLRGPIPEYLFESSRMHTLRMSMNRFEGTISTSFSKLRKLRDLRMSNNRITGSLPQNLFEVTSIESIVLNHNNIGGSVPSEIGSLSKLKAFVLDNNALKGTIPLQMENLTELNMLIIDHNQLTGVAPRFARRFKYSTDCGEPQVLLPNPLLCETCDMCCNSNGDCKQMISRFQVPVYLLAFLIAILAASLASMVFMFLKKSGYHLHRDKDLNIIYAKESTNSFVFSDKTSARLIYGITVLFQNLLFVIYLLESEKSAYSINLPLVHGYAWVSFSIVILCFLGADIVMSLSQLREGFLLEDKSMCVSGAVLLYITIVAMTTSFFYCSVSVENNTELIVDAVILLFIMDLDDRIYFICNKTAPMWTKEIKEEVEQKYKTRFRKYLTHQNAVRNLGVI